MPPPTPTPTQGRRVGAQRERLLEGMTDTAARNGYGAATVTRVIQRAGVSRATFYEHFDDRETCFLAAYRHAAERFLARLTEVMGGGVAPTIRALVECVEEHPSSAQILLTEALAAGPRVRAEYDRTMATLVRECHRARPHPQTGHGRLSVPCFLAIGGVSGVIATRLHRRETASLGALADDLLAWIHSYETRSGKPLWGDRQWIHLGRTLPPPSTSHPREFPPRTLPRGRTPASRTAVTANHRTRVLHAVATLMRSKGYEHTTVGDIVAEANIARGVFYAQFRGKEESFLAAKAATLQESIGASAAAFSLGATWEDRVWEGLNAMFTYTAENPDRAYLELIETHAAGPAAIQRMFESQLAFTIFLADGYRQRPSAGRLPELCSEAIAGSIFALMRRQVIRAGANRMGEVLPLGAYVVLAPFIGAEAAFEYVRERVSGPPNTDRTLSRTGEGSE